MRTSTGLNKTTTDFLAEYVLQHSHSYFTNRFAGSIMTKLGNVVGGFSQVLPELFWTHLTALVSFLVTVGFLVFIDPVSATIFVLLAVVLVWYNRRLAPKKSQLSRAHAASKTKLNGRTIDIIGNVSAVRQYAQLGEEFSVLKDLTNDRRIKNARNWMYTEKMLLVNSVILFVFAFGLFLSLSYSWQSGGVSTGELVFVLSLISQVTGTLIFIGRAINGTAEAFGEIEEGLEDVLIDYEIVDQPGSKLLLIEHSEIAWQQVTFEYGKNKVFNDFNLTIPAGQRLGLVGASGAGKTTFVSLLLRQHELTAGSITIDSQPIHEVTQDSLRANIAVVPQEPALFHRSIRENIAYGKPDATDDEIIEVAKKAQAHDFIKDLPQGYDTLVGERGVKLSGGQKRRVAIARAMLKDAPILILDEATSALDSESEVAIQQALHILMEGKTVIAIAHRLSTLREMDRIIVLDQGQIVEDGDHDTLKITNGTYQRLWEHQAGGFVGE